MMTEEPVVEASAARQTPIMNGVVEEELEAEEPLPGDIQTILVGLEEAVEMTRIEYERLEAENIRMGGEAGQILLSTVEEPTCQLILAIRRVFKKGLKPKVSFLGTVTSSPLLPVLEEITLKTIFAEIMEEASQADADFFSRSGKEMAWILTALNEGSLPQYAEIIRSNPTLAAKYYNPEESIILVDDLAGRFGETLHRLDTVSFALEIASLASYSREKERLEKAQVALAQISATNNAILAPSLNQSLTTLSIKSKSSKHPDDRSTGGTPESPLSTFAELQPNQPAKPLSVQREKISPPLSARVSSIGSGAEPVKHSPLRNIISEGEAAELHISSPSIGSELTATKLQAMLEVKETISDFKEATGNIRPVQRIDILYSKPQSLSSLPFEPFSTTTIASSGESEELMSAKTSETHSTDSAISSTLPPPSLKHADSSLSSDMGIFGFRMPTSSLFTSAVQFFANKRRLRPRRLSSDIPGDFEHIDRVKEKEYARLEASGYNFETQICPVRGLGSQSFECHGCDRVIGIADYADAKLCEVSGFYFCEECFGEETSLSPALIINNWDFRKVQVASETHRRLLPQMHTELVDLEALNPTIFKYINDLMACKEVRLDLVRQAMATDACRAEDKEDVFKRVWPRDHLIETVNLYTIEDLVESHYGKLSRWLNAISRSFQHHINQCPECRVNFEALS